jgi:hypothetical protein
MSNSELAIAVQDTHLDIRASDSDLRVDSFEICDGGDDTTF